MRILVISDVHSNRQALETVLANEKTIDLLVFTGDIVDYGVDPVFTVDFFRFYEGPACIVRGNHDDHLINVYRSGEWLKVQGEEFKWIHYNCQLLDDERVAFIDSLPYHVSFTADGYDYIIQHQYDDKYGVVESPYAFDSYWDKYWTGTEHGGLGRRLVFGHSHRQCVHTLSGDRLWLNPGSVSYRRPDDPDKSAQYMIIENGEIEFRSCPYDRSVQKAVADEYKQKGGMMKTEIQDFMFFFGDAKTSRDPL